MKILPTFITKAASNLTGAIREIAYKDMSRQASDWAPDMIRIKKPGRASQPIELDFAVPKRSRLAWIRRTLQQLPH